MVLVLVYLGLLRFAASRSSMSEDGKELAKIAHHHSFWPLKAQNQGQKARHKIYIQPHKCTLGVLCRQIMDNLHRHSFD